MGQTKFGTCKDGAWKPAGCERNDSMKNKDGKLTSIVGKDAVVGGNFSTPGSARIDGVVEGSARVAGSLIVGSTGRIEGDVEADSIIIGGEINGDVTVQGKAELTATARVIGDIRTSLIVIDEKAVFQGKCDMNIATGKTKKRLAKSPKSGKKSAKAALQEALLEVSEEKRAEEAAITSGEADATGKKEKTDDMA